MKRIAMISEHASPLACLGGTDSGGQNVYVAQVARHLARQGYAVDVFTRRDEPSQQTVVDFEPGLRVIHVPAGPARAISKEDLLPLMAPFAVWMQKFLQKNGGYDLIHANFFMSGMVASRLKTLLGIPFVITFHALGKVRQLHQGAADRFPAERNQIETDLMAHADRIIAECPQDREDQISLYGADASKIRMVPCGFDHQEFQPMNRRKARQFIGRHPDENLVVHIGRMVRRKGVDNVIRGFARLRQHYEQHVRLLVVGGESDEPDPTITPEIGYLQQVARDEGVADSVTFTGRRGRDVLRYYYCAADVFVTTPWYEPFGITPVESMACGTPVIGSNVGGIKYSVMDNGTGLLVPPNDPETLGRALLKLSRDPMLRERFSRLAVKRANAVFTWSRISGAIAELFEDVLASSVSPSMAPLLDGGSPLILKRQA